MRVFSAWPDLRPIIRKRWKAFLKSDFVTKTLPFLFDRVQQYGYLMRLDRQIGTFLLLWPTWWALWIAGDGFPDAKIWVVFTLGVFVMRAAGCIINDFADRKVDGHVKRTKARPMATGKVSEAEALSLFVLLLLIAFLLVSTMNRLTIYLSFGGAALAFIYPFMKRYTHLPQPVLGAAFGWAVPMAFAAQTGTVPPIAWLIFIATVIWATAYDTMYAMVDRDDDLKIGVKSTAILFGDQDRLIIGILQGLLLLSLVLVGIRAGFTSTYFYGLVFATVIALWQQWLIRKRKRDDCFRAFLNNNWFGVFVFAGIALDYIFRAAEVIR
ncbi:MAG: 4-hydroxybenzoate octaprenyltransferase [Gammaproteobacteria bacterium]|nr:4-hydroxybenzoate octaprenyltransferase [Gammaproteobacteria bacterium]